MTNNHQSGRKKYQRLFHQRGKKPYACRDDSMPARGVNINQEKLLRAFLSLPAQQLIPVFLCLLEVKLGLAACLAFTLHLIRLAAGIFLLLQVVPPPCTATTPTERITSRYSQQLGKR